MNRKPGRTNSIVFLTLTVFYSVFLIQGCGNGSVAPASDKNYFTRISSGTVVVPETDAFYLHHRDGDEYVFYSWNEKPGLDRQLFITGTGLGGYLRRIEDVRTDGMFYHVSTSSALLTDVITRGWIATVFPGGADRVDLSDTELYMEAGQQRAGIRIAEGYIEFNPDISLAAGVISGEIMELTFNMEGPIELRTAITVDIASDFLVAEEMLAARFDQQKILYVGSVPIVIDVSLSFMAALSASGTFCDSCRYDLISTGTIDAGGVFERGSWQDLEGLVSESRATPLICSGSSDGSITMTLTPRVSLAIHGTTAFTVETAMRQTVSSSTGVLPDWTWEIAEGSCDRFTYSSDIIGGGVADHEPMERCVGSVLQTGPYRTEDYIFVSTWGREGTDAYEFLFPSGITSGHDGSIYVSDRTASRISRFSPDSTFIGSWGEPGTGKGQFSFPAGLAVGPEGDIFVVDKGNRRIQRFGPDGTFKLSWGSPGDGDGQFREPEGIAISGSGSVYVTDSFSNRVQVFSTTGTLSGGWGSMGEGEGEFNGPIGVCCDPGGNVYISECYNNRVQKFTPEGLFLLSWDGPESAGGDFACPSGIACAPDGNLYVSDYGNDMVHVFGANGDHIATFGSSGFQAGGFDGPYGLTVDIHGDIFVSDSGNSRVQRFSPLQ